MALARHRWMLRRLLITGLGLGLIGIGEAAEVFTSGPEQVALLELFTSEGCSSCPPAEAWLGERRDDPSLWNEFVPIAFHVDYWDRLGWPDRFARREFTERQYAYAQLWGSRSVYTPSFVRNGREWRRGQPNGAPEATGVLTVARMEGARWRISFTPAGRAAESGEFEIQLAVLGGGIVSPVRRGENAGKILHHDFVALGLRSADLALDVNGHFSVELTLEIPRVDGIARTAIAAWVKERGKVEPLQAVGGRLE